MRKVLGLVAVCFAVFALATPVLAGEAESPILSRIVKTGKLRVGMTGDQPPLNVMSKSGEIIGLEVDLANLLASSMQVDLEIVQKPFAQLLPAVEKGELDLVMSGVTITPERNLRVAFVGPYFVSGKSLLTKSKTLAAASGAETINDPSVNLVTLEASTSARFVEMVLPKTKLTTVDSYDAAVKFVIGDKADALVADYPICVLSVLRYPEAGLATLLTPLTIEPIGIALPANDGLLLNLLQNYLGALQSTGVLESLRKRWMEDGSWLAQLP
jgi:polar amino acid transport system substrate-binding protein